MWLSVFHFVFSILGLISRDAEHLCLLTSVRSTAQIYLVLLLNLLKFYSYAGSRFHYYRPVFRVRWYPRHSGFGWRWSTRLFTHKWPLHYRAKSWIKRSIKMSFWYNVLLPCLTYISFFLKMNLPSLGILGIFFLITTVSLSCTKILFFFHLRNACYINSLAWVSSSHSTSQV